MKKYLFAFLVTMISTVIVYAQQPFEEYGYKVKVATLSKGKYVEFFDQDTLVEIGSVVINTNNNQIVYFVTYDTMYSEATLQPEVISRWLSPDPLAGERYDYSPYNFVRNNPVIFTDPTGALDQYYGIVDGTLTYLGDDGQGDNIRLVAEDRHEEAAAVLNKISVSSMHGSGASAEDLGTLRDSEMSQVVTFNEGNIQSEFQGAHDRTRSRGLENSVVITLDIATATVDARAGAEGSNTQVTNTFDGFGGQGQWDGATRLVVGVGHGHPVLKSNSEGKVNGPGYSLDDSNAAGRPDALPSYAIDSYSTKVGRAATIHEVKSGGAAGQNPVGTTQNTNNIGRRSFLSVSRGGY